MGLLDRAGARLTARPEEAEILVVNTCSFIDTAKQESVDTILEMARHKTSGRAKKLIVAGCLVERYRDEIRKNIPEVDAVVGHRRTGVDSGSCRDCAALPAAAASPFNILTSVTAADVTVRSRRQARTRARPTAREQSARRPARRRSARAAGALQPRRVAGRGASCCRLISTTNPRRGFCHAALVGLHQDRRGLRSSVQLLRDSQPARQVPLAAVRVGGCRGAAAGRARRARRSR